MRHLLLFVFSTATWTLAWMAGAASLQLEALRRGRPPGGSSMPGAAYLLGWLLTIAAYFWDHRDSWGTLPTSWELRLTPYGFWTVLGLHALVAVLALASIARDALLLRREARRLQPLEGKVPPR